jgi:hypothetical protein
MTRQSDSRGPASPLREEALADLRRNLARLSMPGLENAYTEAWGKLGITGKPPRAECVQELVQIWRVLRKASR